MTILIQCKCGKKFDVSTDDKRHKPNDEGLSVFVGSRKCPNPSCNRTIYIDAIIMTEINEPEILGSINWNEVEENDIVLINSLQYKIIFKKIQTIEIKDEKRVLVFEPEKILYLRPLLPGENIAVKVHKRGAVTLSEWRPEEDYYKSLKCKKPAPKETWQKERQQGM